MKKSLFNVIDEALADTRPGRIGRPHLGPRAKTIKLKGGKAEARAYAASHRDELRELEAARPRTRGDCRDASRPCPFVACRHHLYLDVTDAGSIKLNYPTLEPWELEHSCSLDVAEDHGRTLDDVGALMNVTRERTRQIEVIALRKLQLAADHADETPQPIPTEAV